MDIFVLSHPEREKLINEHPIVTRDFVIVTPVIEQAYSLIRERVWMRSTGTFLHASQRVGKSICAQTVEALLKKEYQNIAVMSFSATRREGRKAAMFIEMLRAECLHVPNTPRFERIENTLMTHILTQCLQKNSSQFVLIIDEMQNLEEKDFYLLLAIHNRLEKQKIKMTTIGFSQPEILELRTALLANKSYHLIARFLSEPIPFSGCSTSEDLHAILQAYDEEQYYPEDSGISFTEFFLPIAFEGGFRLSNHSNQIWKELKKAASGLESQAMPMQHLTSTVAYLLLAARNLDDKNFKFKNAAIIEAVERSTLKYFSGLLSTFNPPD
ncbi:MAG: ATP-binding protein [Methylotenera sp.]|nr:ATP-binding protein [Methylotenera sp.]MDP2280115.1 ATP-binding protein [Methylotenera sp.]MDP3060629.1 ATP-binding protein [Methylotenera sp.]